MDGRIVADHAAGGGPGDMHARTFNLSEKRIGADRSDRSAAGWLAGLLCLFFLPILPFFLLFFFFFSGLLA